MQEFRTGTPPTVAGYVRLSRDDNRRNYSSIENQKAIIRKFAEQNHMTLYEIYEDDGFSGYSFDRPGFRELTAHLECVDVIAAKDLSRIGRHNAKVLLFLEEMEQLGKRIILIDDHYDSLYSDDDMIGIKTWDNERHVKTTSRKVKRIKKMEQENGTLKSSPPFGYIRHPLNRQLILIDPEAASILNLEKELYLEGNGMRRTAQILNARGVPTPTMLQKERYEALGLPYQRQISSAWSSSMVRDTLFNDYHNGVLRTHKRERTSINGPDRKVPRNQQYVFPDHHPKIFDDATSRLLLEVKESRCRCRYRGQKKHINLFSGCLYCADCGCKLTAVNRPGRAKYYICGTYNKKGKQFCDASHMIREDTLIHALLTYLALCRQSLADVLDRLELSDLKQDAYSVRDSIRRTEAELDRVRSELNTLLDQKIRELAARPSMKDLIEESFSALQADRMERICALQQKLDTLSGTSSECSSASDPVLSRTPSRILDSILEQKTLGRADIEILVQKIVVDRQGNADIYLKYNLDPHETPAIGTAKSSTGPAKSAPGHTRSGMDR